jgi:hypothetical protein
MQLPYQTFSAILIMKTILVLPAPKQFFEIPTAEDFQKNDFYN